MIPKKQKINWTKILLLLLKTNKQDDEVFDEKIDYDAAEDADT